jgi:hypothetical protein
VGLVGGCVLSAGGGGDDAPPPDDPDASASIDAATTPIETIDASAGPADADVSCFGVEATPIFLGALHTGSTLGGVNNLDGCVNAGGLEVYHRIVLDDNVLPADVTFRIDPDLTNFDSVLRVNAGCDLNQGGIELDCFDDDGTLGEDRTTLSLSIPGVYYVIVDSHTGSGGGGDFGLLVTAVPTP